MLISHNNEFTSSVCNETWFVRDGRCEVVSAYAQRLEDAKQRAEEGGGGGDS